jgi:hypothetical protein
MTLPSERYRAIMALKQAAMLIFERGDKRPSLSGMRHAIRSALKHYPHDGDLEKIAECQKCKKILEKE